MMSISTVPSMGRSRAVVALTLAAGMALSVAALAPISVAAQDVTVTTNTTDLGTFLIDKDGNTLYFFSNDTAPGVSACEGDCLANWPPLTVPEGTQPVAGEGVTGVLGAVPMGDGNAWVTYDGRPLYYFAGDEAPGDTNGQGVGEVWYVALEDGSIAAGGAPAGEPGLTLATATTDLGTFLTGVDGKTLYFFTVDAVPGVSACDAECLANWPPATVAEGQIAEAGEGVTGVVNMTTTTDGQPIVTYDGRPLYYFAGDAAAGETNGQGLGDVWFVALVDGSVPPPAAADDAAASPAASPAG
jgi:predicted lipoprotein with Yx(FWY)xxD motif